MHINVGKKVVNYRRKNDLTIKDLSDRTGLSTALISQLERGIGNPSISALESLASEMKISLADLVATQIENKDLICRVDDRGIVLDNENIQLAHVLVESAINTSLSVLMIKLQARSASSTEFSSHVEEECFIVLKGQMVMTFEDEEFVLNEGDSIRILPQRQHLIINNSDEPATAINIKCKVQY